MRLTRPPVERVLDHTTITEGCWDCALAPSQRHAVVRVGSRTDGTYRQRKAHRVVYEEVVGPIPDGYDIDHLCDNGRCVNPDHLEAVPPGENTRRYWERTRG